LPEGVRKREQAVSAATKDGCSLPLTEKSERSRELPSGTAPKKRQVPNDTEFQQKCQTRSSDSPLKIAYAILQVMALANRPTLASKIIGKIARFFYVFINNFVEQFLLAL